MNECPDSPSPKSAMKIQLPLGRSVRDILLPEVNDKMVPLSHMPSDGILPIVPYVAFGHVLLTPSPATTLSSLIAFTPPPPLDVES